MPHPNIIIAITGASGSGKTTLANYLQDSLGKSKCTIICQDSYYKDLSHLDAQKRAQTNFDHPSSIDFYKLQLDLLRLKNNQRIEQPMYDFKNHCRKTDTKTIKPKPYIIIEGTLVLSQEIIRKLLDYSVYLEVDLDLCLKRRIYRDTRERGRSVESINKQYEAFVVPMYYEFIKPSKKFAHLVTDEDNFQLLSRKIIDQIKKSK